MKAGDGVRNIPDFPLQVFYDGSCAVCALEIKRYRDMDRDGRLNIIDISAPGFETAGWGISQSDFMRELHVIDRNGTVYRGVDAFAAIWLAFPESSLPRLLARLIRLPVVDPLARLGYRIFARFRRYLPKRAACAGDNCRIGH